MKDKTHAELACEAAKALSFNCFVEGPRLPFRGYAKTWFHRYNVIAEKAGSEYYLNWDKTGIFRQIMNDQDQIPMAARIAQIAEIPSGLKSLHDCSGLEYLVFIEKVDGILLWELEGDDRPTVEKIAEDLNKFVDSIDNLNLRHGDLRPWNIIYNPENAQIKVIDWEESKYGEPDSDINDNYRDVEHIISVLKKPELSHDLWSGGFPYTWVPSPWGI